MSDTASKKTENTKHIIESTFSNATDKEKLNLAARLNAFDQTLRRELLQWVYYGQNEQARKRILQEL
jgi:hypothetical protein